MLFGMVIIGMLRIFKHVKQGKVEFARVNGASDAYKNSLFVESCEGMAVLRAYGKIEEYKDKMMVLANEKLRT
jgi:hypothetical protein